MIPASVSLSHGQAVEKRLNGSTSYLEWRLEDPRHILLGVSIPLTLREEV